ncbi:MBL fold metallo-hydrolase [Streptomyces sp. NPDC057011]|uniref:MBL fold metallo-hydrolase n=1 Tax=unclassified Streptomyces TaxID=2593676 RepID=UPI0036392144
MSTHKVGPDTTVLADCLEVPGIGFIPVNAFVLHAEQPVVVDTGLGLPDRDFLNTLGSVLDPEDVRWIWLTHPDRDHTGGLFELLAAAPEARLVTTFMGAGIMSCERPVPLDRVYFLNPGQSLDVGDRTLHAFRPPLFDNPATVALYDDRSHTCFSSDCFGGPLPTAEAATGTDVAGVPAGDLRAAQRLWASVDSPWVQMVDPDRFLTSIEPLRSMDPETILCTHLPPATGLTTQFLDTISALPGIDPFVGPDQAALAQLLAGFEPGGAA